MDVSTVDGATSKLINGHIKSTGALFLEVQLVIVSFPLSMAHIECCVIRICIIALNASVRRIL